MRLFSLLVACVCSLGLTGVAFGQGEWKPDGEFKLPADPTMWVNSGPITSEALKGKAAFLWFFEEQCPRCREKWPSLMELAKRYEGKPIVFIAVNSGNGRPAVEQYMRGVGCSWPTIVDATRQLETRAGVGEISLQNVHQVCVITADGQLRLGSWNEPATSIDQVLAGAKWLVPPEEVPPALKPAWLNIEFNQFAAAGPMVKKAFASNKDEIKQGAAKLNDAVQTKIAADVTAAEEALSAGGKWKAYKTYYQITTQYAGFAMPDGVAEKMKELSTDEEVARQIAATKALDTAKRLLRSTSSGTRRSAAVRLKKLIGDHPGTEAADEAAELIKQLEAS